MLDTIDLKLDLEQIFPIRPFKIVILFAVFAACRFPHFCVKHRFFAHFLKMNVQFFQCCAVLRTHPYGLPNIWAQNRITILNGLTHTLPSGTKVHTLNNMTKVSKMHFISKTCIQRNIIPSELKLKMKESHSFSFHVESFT